MNKVVASLLQRVLGGAPAIPDTLLYRAMVYFPHPTRGAEGRGGWLNYPTASQEEMLERAEDLEAVAHRLFGDVEGVSVYRDRAIVVVSGVSSPEVAAARFSEAAG